ncbi:MAG: hypothetical protein CMP36_01390 [Rickettsiales bacterium]|nr:hypothetical protein [Marinovum sp.]MAJ24144.1 hypothetical protein [Rickettsiales bacterium]OUV75679.1 MAG: hypothetical protein CBC91_07165 [Rickettsiales bacterium TMED131]OUV81947.1 MAG: hypothetical protein CBC91_01890 [Rickettsiales bacterium TMED131]|tara:strand:+ start:3212 stop:5065 length:1854 start_codon:yes stop_codon:yes gene_type:complete
MASTKLDISELDFDQLKSNLKSFLQSQSEFSDYNFEGSGFAVLLDVLAYNTHYLGFNANMLANEMYLDSADVRANVVSLAKMIGYTSASAKAPVASLDITVNDATGTTLTMDKGQTFTTSVDGTTYNFITNTDLTITPVDGVFKFSSVPVYEGTPITFRYTVDSTDADQKFLIPSVNADTSTLRIRVQTSLTDTTSETFTNVSGLTNLSDTSAVYFLSETETGKFQITFGDGVLGKKLSNGNIVILDYIVTNKDEANGASTFTPAGNIGNFSNLTVATVSNAQGGSEPESKESIRYNAPLQYTAQDRAVTTSDYEGKVRSIYPNAQSVSAWGGEDDETPIYGVVKIAIKAASGSTLTTQTKSDIVSKLKEYNVGSVTPQIVDPEITSILLNTSAKYNASATTKDAETLKANIITNLTNYNTSTLQKFDSVFRFSKVSTLIDGTDASILSNITTIKIRKSLQPTINSSLKYNIYFRNGLYNPHTGHNSTAGGILTSTGFKVSGNTNEQFLDDDGNGNVRAYYLSGATRVYTNSTQGTIDYTTGAITINSLQVTEISNIRGSASSVIELTVQPASNDIVPVRDQIIELDISNSTISVQKDTFVAGSSDAGVGYTTTSAY